MVPCPPTPACSLCRAPNRKSANPEGTKILLYPCMVSWASMGLSFPICTTGKRSISETHFTIFTPGWILGCSLSGQVEGQWLPGHPLLSGYRVWSCGTLPGPSASNGALGTGASWGVAWPWGGDPQFHEYPSHRLTPEHRVGGDTETKSLSLLGDSTSQQGKHLRGGGGVTRPH